MGKLLHSVTMSLDGFIAGPGGDMSWLTEHLEPNPAVDEIIGNIGALLVGNRTFRGDDPYKGTSKEGKPFGGGWTGPRFVLTHHAPDTPVPGVTFVCDLDSGVAAAKAAAGDRYVNVLGANTAHQCLDAVPKVPISADQRLIAPRDHLVSLEVSAGPCVSVGRGRGSSPDDPPVRRGTATAARRSTIGISCSRVRHRPDGSPQFVEGRLRQDPATLARMSVLNDAARAAIVSGRLAHLVTLNPDGSPQVSVVWIGLDGDEIVTGHMGDRQKLRNIRRDPRVVLSLETGAVNEMGLGEYLVVQGIGRVTDGGAAELLQRLAHVYVGPDVTFPRGSDHPPGLILRITPDHVGGVGPWAAR